MITPLDIQNKEFSKGVRGYKEEEVDIFLDLITADMESLIAENKRLKEQVAKNVSEIERYKGSEGTVYETLEAAKALMQDISASADKRAQMVMKNAELDAEIIQREAKESVEKLNEEYANIKASLTLFKAKYRALLETELEKFDTLSAELFTDQDITFSEPDMPHKTSEQQIKAVKSFADLADDERLTDAKTITNIRTDGEKA